MYIAIDPKGQGDLQAHIFTNLWLNPTYNKRDICNW